MPRPRDHAFWLLVFLLGAGCKPDVSRPEPPGASAAAPTVDSGGHDGAREASSEASAPAHDEPLAAGSAAPAPAAPAGPFPHPRRAAFRGVFVDLATTGPVLDDAPAEYRFDGDVAEWSAMPTTSLPTENGRASVVFALTDKGFYVAGNVDAHAGDTRLDHVRVNVALVHPVMPPIAFASHLTGAVVDAAWCRDEVTKTFGFDEKAPNAAEEAKEATRDCLAWLAKCEDLRAQIEERFEKTVTIDLGAAKVTGVAGARVLVQRRDGGTGATFEAEIPLTSMPETAEMPLRTVRVAARLYSPTPSRSPDGGSNALEPAWNIFVRRDPLRLHRLAPLVEHIMAESAASTTRGDAMRVAASYVPAPTSRAVSFFFNIGEAGQWTPSAISPQVADVDVAAGRTIFTLHTGAAASDGGAGGDITISAHAASFDDTFGTGHPKVSLVSRRGDAVLDVSASTSFDPYTLVARAPGVHILDVYQGPAGPYGSGPSGAMTGYEFEIFKMDATGHFTGPQAFDLMIHRGYILTGQETLPGFEDQFGISAPSLSISPTLERFGLAGTFTTNGPPSDADATYVDHAFKIGYRWDPTKGDYVRFGSAHVVRDGG